MTLPQTRYWVTTWILMQPAKQSAKSACHLWKQIPTSSKKICLPSSHPALLPCPPHRKSMSGYRSAWASKQKYQKLSHKWSTKLNMVICKKHGFGWRTRGTSLVSLVSWAFKPIYCQSIKNNLEKRDSSAFGKHLAYSKQSASLDNLNVTGRTQHWLRYWNKDGQVCYCDLW